MTIRVLVLILLLAAADCGGAGRTATGEWKVDRTTEGSVTTVRTLSGSKWGGTARLAQTLSIGSVEGDENELFGEVTGLAFTSDRIYVLDRTVPIVRMYDRSGKHLGDIGGHGQGPGEYLAPFAISVSEGSDRLFVRDDRLGRIQVFTLTGDFVESWRTNAGIMTFTPMVITGQGVVYTTVAVNPGSWDSRKGLLGIGPEGALGDTLKEPVSPHNSERLMAVDGAGYPIISRPVPFAPQSVWAVTPALDVVSSTGESYRIRVERRDGTTTLIERIVDPVPVQPGESKWTRRRTEAEMHGALPGWSWNGPPIPGTKPYVDELFTDADGRIWVLRKGYGVHHEGCNEDPKSLPDWQDNPCWTEPLILDVFAAEGSYLGEVQIPPGMSDFPSPVVRGDDLLAAATDEADVPYVRMYRLVLPNRGS